MKNTLQKSSFQNSINENNNIKNKNNKISNLNHKVEELDLVVISRNKIEDDAKEIKSKSKVYLMALNAGLGSFYFGYN